MKSQLLILSLLPTLALRAAEIGAIPHPEETFPKNTTVVWTPLFQAAWDELNRSLGQPTKIDPPSMLMDRLDHFEWRAKSVMPASGWKVWAGEATQERIDTANAEAAQMTGERNGPFTITTRNQGRIALGLLQKNLVFRKPLYRATTTLLAFRGEDGTETKVAYFGVRGKTSGLHGHMVRVLNYREGSHAIQIAGVGDESAVLYLPEAPTSFNAACAKLREWCAEKQEGDYGSAEDPALHADDDLRIPILKMTSTADFLPTLGSLRYYAEGTDPWQINRAMQSVRFELDERGVKLIVKVESGADPFGDPPPPPPNVPRTFHYDRPFFVFLWRDGADWPYFGSWIGDSSAMQEFNER